MPNLGTNGPAGDAHQHPADDKTGHTAQDQVQRQLLQRHDAPNNRSSDNSQTSTAATDQLAKNKTASEKQLAANAIKLSTATDARDHAPNDNGQTAQEQRNQNFDRALTRIDKQRHDAGSASLKETLGYDPAHVTPHNETHQAVTKDGAKDGAGKRTASTDDQKTTVSADKARAATIKTPLQKQQGDIDVNLLTPPNAHEEASGDNRKTSVPATDQSATIKTALEKKLDANGITLSTTNDAHEEASGDNRHASAAATDQLTESKTALEKKLAANDIKLSTPNDAHEEASGDNRKTSAAATDQSATIKTALEKKLAANDIKLSTANDAHEEASGDNRKTSAAATDQSATIKTALEKKLAANDIKLSTANDTPDEAARDNRKTSAAATDQSTTIKTALEKKPAAKDIKLPSGDDNGVTKKVGADIDAAAPKKVAGGNLSLNELLERDTDSYYFPDGDPVGFKQRGIDRTRGATSRDVEITKDPKTGVVKIQETRMGIDEGMQYKRIKANTPDRLEENVARRVQEAMEKFDDVLRKGESVSNWGWSEDGTRYKLVLRDFKELRVHIEVEEFAKLQPDDQERLRQAATEMAESLSDAGFGRQVKLRGVPVKVEVVEAAPPHKLSEGKLPEGKLPEGKLPEGKLPEGKLPEGKLPEGKLAEGKLPDGKLPDGKLPDGKLPDGKLPDGKLPDGKLPEGPDSSLPAPAGAAGGPWFVERLVQKLGPLGVVADVLFVRAIAQDLEWHFTPADPKWGDTRTDMFGQTWYRSTGDGGTWVTSRATAEGA